jgi:hypothetical protein
MAEISENIRYLMRDCTGRPVGCALFGSAAWKCAARDAWIGWARARREANLGFLTNNTRFLVLPWVTVPHLASHLLATLARRVRDDWQAKYGHPVHALETFVECDRFKGTCYRAANWLRLGSTQGRTRNDRNHCLRATVKDVYLYPLSPDFRARRYAWWPCRILQCVARSSAARAADVPWQNSLRTVSSVGRSLICPIRSFGSPSTRLKSKPAPAAASTVQRSPRKS